VGAGIEVVERGLWLGPEGRAAHRKDLVTFVDHALRLDDAAVIRLRARSRGLLSGADALARGLSAMDAAGYVDPGFSMDSAWRGALPPESGFVHVDDVPARVMLDLAQRGARLAKEHGSSHGPPVSLLDQEVIRVTSAVEGADVSVGLPMRCVFALTAMGFLPQSPDAIAADEMVRVRVLPNWLRVDAKFGSVYRRRGHPALVLR